MINKNYKPTELCELAYKYGTDKCPQLKHAYTPFYYNLLKDRKNSIKKVLELGIGHYRNMQNVNTIYDPGLKRTYHKGASLYMWRDFFPNAKIYGADIAPETIFQDDRITTHLCDERQEEELKKLIQDIGPDIDIVIDDASHHVDDQIFAAKILLPLLSKDVIYIIEDVSRSQLIINALSEASDYEFEVPDIPRKLRGEEVLVIKKQHGK